MSLRIRSIRPEFWASEDVASLSWEHRLIFIGLWSYVDDNGVGRDIERLILADLFPLDEDQKGALKQIHGALSEFSGKGMLSRYVVDDKPYLHITNFGTHQVINRPSRGRYPLPTCGNAEPHAPLTEPSVSPHANEVIGEGEKGRRGEGEKTPAAAAAEPDGFAEFWAVYPKRVAKGAAITAYRKALKLTDLESLVLGAKRYAAQVAKADPQYIANPATWLNAQRWYDETPGSDGPRRPNLNPWRGQ